MKAFHVFCGVFCSAIVVVSAAAATFCLYWLARDLFGDYTVYKEGFFVLTGAFILFGALATFEARFMFRKAGILKLAIRND